MLPLEQLAIARTYRTVLSTARISRRSVCLECAASWLWAFSDCALQGPDRMD